MPRKSLVDFETEMDETARLILMISDDEGKDIDVVKFSNEFKKAHVTADVVTVMRFWRKWHGSYDRLPTHDYKTGRAL